MTDTPPDALTALAHLMRADAAIAAIAPARVFRDELPEGETEATEIDPAVVVRYSGGPRVGGYLPLSRDRLDVKCYGRTPREADDLHRAVHGYLKQLRRTTRDGAVIHSVSPAGGRLSTRDPDTDWPYVFSSWSMRAAEVSAV